jgi:hypothetical protein
MIWLIYKADGEIVGAAANAEWAQVAAGDALSVIEHSKEINIREYLVQGGMVIRKADAVIASDAEARELAEAWRQLRFRRSRLLSKTDWTQVPDSPADAAAWAIYRQALRDLPQNTPDPRNVIWPEPPA